MTWFHLNASDQKRWDSLKEAYGQAKEQDSGKSTQDHLKETFASPFYFAKGVAEGSLKLLESGVAPILRAGSETLLFIQNPKAYLEDQGDERKTLQSKIKGVILHPVDFLHRLSEGIKDGVTEGIVHFITEPEAQRSEAVGKLAPGIALNLVGGEALKIEALASDLAKVNEIQRIPFGFKNYEEFEKFGATLKHGLEQMGITDAQAFLRGSSVTGNSFRTGLAFDVGRTSDFDVAISSPSLLERAKSVGIQLRSKGTRTSPLKGKLLERIELTHLVNDLNKDVGREISVMLYISPEAVYSRGPNLPFP
jgi:hypothetical protein